MLPVAILAGGRATRLRPLSDNLPKSLIPIAGKPFIDYQLRLLATNGIDHVVICAGYLGEMIRDYVGSGLRYGMVVEFSYDGPRPLGTGGALGKAFPMLGEAAFVLYGDSYLPCDFSGVQDAFVSSDKLALMTVRNSQGHSRNVVFDNGVIREYSKRRPTEQMHHVDYGLGVFKHEAFVGFPYGSAYDLADEYRRLLDEDELAALEVDDPMFEVGSFLGIAALRAYMQGYG